MKVLTAQEVVQRAAQSFVEDGEDWQKQILLWGLRSIKESVDRAQAKGGESLIGGPQERFQFVQYDEHSLLFEAYRTDQLEVGDILGTLELMVDKTHSWNQSRNLHNLSHRKYPEGHVIKFWGIDGEFYIMLVGTCLWHFQQEQSGVLFRRVKMAMVTYTEEKGDSAVTMFIGTDNEAIAFAQKLSPDLHVMNDHELMGLQGCEPMPDGTQPWVANLGLGILTVSGYQF